MLTFMASMFKCLLLPHVAPTLARVEAGAFAGDSLIVFLSLVS